MDLNHYTTLPYNNIVLPVGKIPSPPRPSFGHWQHPTSRKLLTHTRLYIEKSGKFTAFIIEINAPFFDTFRPLENFPG